MTEPSKAVFLSYASQDAEAAKRICDALSAGGIEVWFDQSELRGGDAWDAAIRKQIKACALFIPIISRNAHSRDEGYFRLEWKLAVDRSHLKSGNRAFLVPVVIDDTPDSEEGVPDRFRELQWSRLPEGETPPAFVERIARLLSSDPSPATAPHPAAAIPAPASREPLAGPVSTHKPQRVALLIALLVAVIGIGYVVLDKLVLSRHPAAPSQGSAAQADISAPSAIPEKSVAVLPFADMSEKKDQEYFSDGLSEELIDMLSKVPDLRVPARTSSFHFKGKDETLDTIAKQLKVANLLEGSVRKAGDRLRVTAQLIRADNGYHLWSETYDRDAKDIFKVQDEIAAAVVEALKAKLAPNQQVASHRTSKPEAYNQYLLGRQFYDRNNLDDVRHAVEAYHRAIAIDPGYAAAYAGLTYAEDYIADQTGDTAGFERAQAAADKAVALAPEQADGYAARGFERFGHNWDWTGGLADLQKARALDPADSTVQLQYAYLLEGLGRLPEAIEADTKATELDPLSSRAWDRLGRFRMENRDFAGAHAAIQRAIEIQPDSAFAHNGLGALLLIEGNAVGALASYHKVNYEGFRSTGIAMAEHSLGHAQEAQQALDEAIAKNALESAYQIGEAYAWRGEKDKAFEWLERAYQQRDGGMVELKSDLLLAKLHGDPRFHALERKLGVSD
jgi:TolB-like protein